ncbi:MarR family transcriptional regulator [Acetobacteraceae bacterium KSS8]|uniref:MarR family transcriptional regulator n=1 Tax=Endosaccharibacter trunci TaxID=2812733 RepID=A0ABT1W368_9PROT|nr:MarR family transcriptional regulator [Acetobacteraceae bacterium KSS8]
MANPSLDDQLCFALYSANMAVNRAYKPLLDKIGITYPQYLVLMALWDEDERTIGAIAARLGLESSTVTPLVKRLESAGFAARTRNPADERQVVVRLTERGRALRGECGVIGQAVFRRPGLTLAGLASLRDDVRALRDVLSETEA